MTDSKASADEPMQIYLANAALQSRRYDLAATVEIAAREAFAGVQLYVNEKQARDLAAIDDVARAARDARLGVIVHLPPETTESIAAATRCLLRHEARPRALVHYDPVRPLPEIEGVQVGLENAVQGLDDEYYARWLAARRARATFVAFDLPRLFGRENVDLRAAREFASRMLRQSRPDDLLHLIDQKRPGDRRADWCVLGEGLAAPFLPRLARHGGPIVLEFETLEHALASRDVLLRKSRL